MLGLSMVTTWSYDRLKMGELKLLPERLQKKNRDLDCTEVATCVCITHCGNFVLIGYSQGHVDRFVAICHYVLFIISSKFFDCCRFNIQSGMWRCAYGDSKAHTLAIRGVATDGLNQIVISGGSDCLVKFWHFKNRSKLVCVY